MAERPTYLMIPRKFVIAWFVTVTVPFLMILGSYQYANYVDRKSNEQWCEVIVLFNTAYKTNPPPTDLGKKIAKGMLDIQNKFHCKNT